MILNSSEKINLEQVIDKPSLDINDSDSKCRNLIELANEVFTTYNKYEDNTKSNVNTQIREYMKKPIEDNLSFKLRKEKQELNTFNKLPYQFSYTPYSTTLSKQSFTTDKGPKRAKNSCKLSKDESHPLMKIDIILENTKEQITVYPNDTASSLATNFALKHRKVVVKE